MGHVYLAQDTNLPRKVAVKFLHPQFKDDPAMRESLREEAKRYVEVEAYHHIDYGEIEGIPYLIMPYYEITTISQIRGSTRVASRFRRRRPRDSSAPSRKRWRGRPLGVVHRDPKPSNILFDVDHDPVIVDFGLAAPTKHHDSAVTRITGPVSSSGRRPT